MTYLSFACFYLLSIGNRIDCLATMWPLRRDQDGRYFKINISLHAVAAGTLSDGTFPTSQ